MIVNDKADQLQDAVVEIDLFDLPRLTSPNAEADVIALAKAFTA